MDYHLTMTKPLLYESTQSPDGLPSSIVIHDAIFQVADTQGLRLIAGKDCEEAVSSLLCSEVSRSPSNVKTHIRRVWFEYDRKNRELLFASLLDLWIALNGSGRALFRRMLLGAKNRLHAKQFDQLARLYGSKTLRKGELPEASGAVLSKGLNGRLDLVKESEGTGSGESIQQDPLQEAHECLEYSQIEQAQKILEKALLDCPSREAIHADLLEIYKSTKNLDALKSMREKLGDKANPFLDRWNELQEKMIEEKG